MDSRTGLPVVGMVGGGQLARMTHQAAIALGQSLRVLAATGVDGAALVTADTVIGDHTDLETLRRFAKGCDVVTFAHNHVPTGHVLALEADGVIVRPSADALRFVQDKRALRERLRELGLPVAARRPAFTAAGVDAVVGEPPNARREVVALVARSPWGQVASYPVVETVRRDGVCVEVLAPAPALHDHVAEHAQWLAITIATDLNVVGILAVQMIQPASGELMLDELAMRPHSSGAWTIEGARTSQFEQHLRAVLDYPLGETSLTAPAIAVANVFGGPPQGTGIDERLHHLFAEDPGVGVHLGGEQVRPGSMIGHVTVLGRDMEALRARAMRAARWLSHGETSHQSLRS